MTASMARRIRCAESLLIYAIDRQYGEQRDRSRAAQPQTHPIRFLVVDPNGIRWVATRNRTRDPNPALHERKTMGTNIATVATSPALIPAAVQAGGGKEYTDEEVRRLVAALEEPFDPSEIKWRVTNTTKDQTRGQVMAYADQRAYTDGLNASSLCAVGPASTGWK